MKRFIVLNCALMACQFANAQTTPHAPQNQMVFLGSYNAGQPGVNVYKFLDPTEEVLCYILMPVVAGRKQLDNGAIIYDGNTIGSMSCVKISSVKAFANESSKKK